MIILGAGIFAEPCEALLMQKYQRLLLLYLIKKRNHNLLYIFNYLMSGICIVLGGTTITPNPINIIISPITKNTN